MTKIAMITDTHFGCREGKEVFHSYFEDFYSKIFFPTLKERGINTILHLGDLMDRRKYIDYYSLKRSKEYFFNPLKESGATMHVLIGNHDIALRNTLDINSPDLLLQEYDNIKPISSVTELSFPGSVFLMMPWVCSDNYVESMNAIKNSEADICCGHFEISGFSMYRGMESHDGFDSNLFNRFTNVFSGHYHHKNSQGTIMYLGNPYHMTWQDYGDIRGFHIFDTETRELEFIPNTLEIFSRFVYDDDITPDHSSVDMSIFEKKFVKIVVQKKTDFYKFDQFMESVYNKNPHEVKVIETIADITQEEMDESVDIEDTRSILEHYVSNSDVPVDKDVLKKYIGTLYTEALHAE